MSFFSINELKTITVILDSRSTKGSGTEEDPHRTIIDIYTVDGDIIATDDPLVKSIISEYSLYLHKKKNNLKIKKEDFFYLKNIDFSNKKNIWNI